MSRGEIHSLVDIRMPSHRTSSYKVWTVSLKRRSIDEAIALRRWLLAKRGIFASRIGLHGPRRLLVLHKIGDICGFRRRWTNALKGPIVLFGK